MKYIHGKIVFVILVPIIFLATEFAVAAVKDSDADGISDDGETSIYLTNPNIYDTDGDRIGDGEEVLDGTNPLDPEVSRLTTPFGEPFGIFGDPDKFAWYFARATGILSFVLLTIVVAHGLMISSRAFIRRYSPAVALEVHRFLSWVALATVILHFSSFFFDNFLRISVMEMLIPFLIDRDFRTAIGFDIGKTVGIGIIAFYLIVILIFTSEFRSKMSAKLWRTIHYSSFVAYPLFLLHGILSGTDSMEWWVQMMYVISGVLVLALIVIRIVFRNILPKIRQRRAVAQTAIDVASRTETIP